jgi:hypothetical protein
MNTDTGFANGRLGVICCGHVFRRERAARLIARDEQGWQFLCGGGDHASAKDGNFVMVDVLLGFDPSLHDIADLPVGWEAERKDQDSPWIRTRSHAIPQ